MNPKKLIAALGVSGITRYKISKDTGLSDGLLSDIVNGSDDRATSIKTARRLAEYAEQFGLDASGDKLKRKRKAS